MPASYREYQRAYSELAERLPNAKRLIEEHRYGTAKSEFNELLELSKLADKKVSEMRVFSRATSALNFQRKQVDDIWGKYHKTSALYTARNLQRNVRSQEIDCLMRSINDQKGVLDRLLTIPPFNLSLNDSELRLFTRDVGAFCSAIEALVEEQERMERRFRFWLYWWRQLVVRQGE